MLAGKVTRIEDDSAEHFKRSLEQSIFVNSDRLDAQSVLIFYVAGHGVEIQGLNYLVPTDAKLWINESDAKKEGVNLTEVVSQVRATSSGTVIFLFDICRNNPFRDVSAVKGRGMAAMPVRAIPGPKSTARAPLPKRGRTYIMFSTQPGQVATDGPSGRNSPFASAIAEELPKMNGSTSETLRAILDSVKSRTGGTQIPWLDTDASGAMD